MIDPEQRFVYLGREPNQPWWKSGSPTPCSSPRDLRWYLPDPWEWGKSVKAVDSYLVITLDLRTLKLYARFGRLSAERENALDRRRGT